MATLWPQPQPSYGGKPLSEWVVDLQGEFTVEQATALDAMGTKAVPYLLTWVAYDTPRWKALWYSSLNRVRSVLQKPKVTDRQLRLAEEAETALSRFVRTAPEIGAECRRLAIQPNLAPRVRQRINHLLYVEWSYRGGHTNLQLLVATNGAPRGGK